MVMFLLSFVKGSKSAEGGKNPLADMDPGGPNPPADMDRGVQFEGGPNPLGHQQISFFKMVFAMNLIDNESKKS